eukprot:1108619-Pelagomonas_calceolata.AAC.5
MLVAIRNMLVDCLLTVLHSSMLATLKVISSGIVQAHEDSSRPPRGDPGSNVCVSLLLSTSFLG